jgi:hypothetical protein
MREDVRKLASTTCQGNGKRGRFIALNRTFSQLSTNQRMKRHDRAEHASFVPRLRIDRTQVIVWTQMGWGGAVAALQRTGLIAPSG